MKIILITDIHGAVEQARALSSRVEKVDAVFIAGDITHFGHRDTAEEIVRSVKGIGGEVFAVPGNCDYPDVLEYLEEEDISLHGRGRKFGEYFLLGVGGSLPAPVQTPFTLSEQDAASILEKGIENRGGEEILLISHQPPHKTRADRAMRFRHVGSRSVINFIRKHEPLFCGCGHIHESRGADLIGPTHIVNPGPLKDGRYAVIHLDGSAIRVELKKL